MLSDAARKEIKLQMARYPDTRSALLPALYVAQGEYGWLPQEAIDEVAELMGLSPTQVGSVASFYSMFYLKPVGKHVVDFCTDMPCGLKGMEQTYARLREKLGLGPGQETTADGMITLRPAMCLGGCHHAPVLLIDNQKQAENLTDEQLDQLIEKLRADARAGVTPERP